MQALLRPRGKTGEIGCHPRGGTSGPDCQESAGAAHIRSFASGVARPIDPHTRCRYGAPTVLIVAFNKENVYTYPGGSRQSGIEDASIVATHMMLAAQAQGVDSCWVNCFDPEKLHAALGLPADEEILMLLDLGYAAEGVGPLPNHFDRKPLSDTVTYL